MKPSDFIKGYYMKLCDYGCKQQAKYQLKNGKWCCNKSSNSCIEFRRKKIGKPSGMLGKHHSEESNKKRSEKISGEKHYLFGRHPSIETRMKSSKSHKGIKPPNSGKTFEESYGEERSKELKENLRKSNKGKKKTIETRKKQSKSHKENFKNPEFCKEFGKRFQVKPNNPETILIKLLGSGYKYVGNYQVWINGKNPDFINEENKKIIEFFGDYWHDIENTGKSKRIHINERKKHFEKEGYKVLIIQQKDLKNIENLKKKIQLF